MLAWVPQAHQDPRGGGGQGVALVGSRSMGSVGEGGTKAQEWASPPQCGTEGMEGWDMSVHTGVRWGSWRLSHRPQEGVGASESYGTPAQEEPSWWLCRRW